MRNRTDGPNEPLDREPDGGGPDGASAAPDGASAAPDGASAADDLPGVAGTPPKAGMPPFDPDGDPPPDPDDRESAYELLRRGQALAAKRHFAQAAVVLGRAARLEPRKGSILEALGRALYNSGQHERARETFERLLEIDPSSDYGHYALGQSLKQLGRRREARTHLRIAVALAPSSRLYAGALRRLGPAPTADRERERGSDRTAAAPWDGEAADRQGLDPGPEDEGGPHAGGAGSGPATGDPPGAGEAGP